MNLQINVLIEKKIKVTIIAVFAPEETKPDKSKAFYRHLQLTKNKYHKTDQIIPMEGFNSRIEYIFISKKLQNRVEIF